MVKKIFREKVGVSCLLLALGIVLLAPAPPAPPPASKPAPASPAKGPPPTGDEIMKRVRDHEYSESMDAVISMELIDKNGKKQVRKFRIQRYKDSVLIRFLEPPDIKGTGYLIIKDKSGKTLVYVYFPPPTDDYRQINVEGEDANQAFLGSDFDVTDFQIRNPNETTNTYVRTETLAGVECYVVESIPKDPNYKYGKIISWIRTDYYLPVQVQFYDRSKPPKMVKEMRVLKYKEVQGKWITSKSEMTNKANGHKTVLEVQEIKFDVKFPDDNFTIRRLTKP